MHRLRTENALRLCTCPRGPYPSDAAPNAAPSTHLPIVKTLENQFACETLAIWTPIRLALSNVGFSRNHPLFMHRHAGFIRIFRFCYCAGDSLLRVHVDFAVCSPIQRRKSAEPPSMGSTTKAGLV